MTVTTTPTHHQAQCEVCRVALPDGEFALCTACRDAGARAAEILADKTIDPKEAAEAALKCPYYSPLRLLGSGALAIGMGAYFFGEHAHPAWLVLSAFGIVAAIMSGKGWRRVRFEPGQVVFESGDRIYSSRKVIPAGDIATVEIRFEPKSPSKKIPDHFSVRLKGPGIDVQLSPPPWLERHENAARLRDVVHAAVHTCAAAPAPIGPPARLPAGLRISQRGERLDARWGFLGRAGFSVTREGIERRGSDRLDADDLVALEVRRISSNETELVASLRNHHHVRLLALADAGTIESLARAMRSLLGLPGDRS